MLEYLRPVWATPEQDRLFSDARAERLKFFDRLVFAADPDHAALDPAGQVLSVVLLGALTYGVLGDTHNLLDTDFNDGSVWGAALRVGYTF